MENRQKPARNKQWTTLKKWKHCEVHNETYKPGKSIKYNEQHLKKWKCNEHLWRKDNEHVEVKTNKNIQQNNVNGWQKTWKTIENQKNTMETLKPEGTTLKKQRKNKAKHWNK